MRVEFEDRLIMIMKEIGYLGKNDKKELEGRKVWLAYNTLEAYQDK